LGAFDKTVGQTFRNSGMEEAPLPHFSEQIMVKNFSEKGLEERWSALVRDNAVPKLIPLLYDGGVTFSLHNKQTTQYFSLLAKNSIKREIMTWNRYLNGFWINPGGMVCFKQHTLTDELTPKHWKRVRLSVFRNALSFDRFHNNYFVLKEDYMVPVKELWIDDVLLMCTRYYPYEVVQIIMRFYRRFVTVYRPIRALLQEPDASYANRDREIQEALDGRPHLPHHGFCEYSFGEIPIHLLTSDGHRFTMGSLNKASVYVIVPDSVGIVRVTINVPTVKKYSSLVAHNYVPTLCPRTSSKDGFNLRGWVVYKVAVIPDQLCWIVVKSKKKWGARPAFFGIPACSPACSEICATSGGRWVIFKNPFHKECHEWFMDGISLITGDLEYEIPTWKREYLPYRVENVYFDLHVYFMGVGKFSRMVWLQYGDGGHIIAGNNQNRVGFCGTTVPTINIKGQDINLGDINPEDIPRNDDYWFHFMELLNGRYLNIQDDNSIPEPDEDSSDEEANTIPVMILKDKNLKPPPRAPAGYVATNNGFVLASVNDPEEPSSEHDEDGPNSNMILDNDQVDPSVIEAQ